MKTCPRCGIEKPFSEFCKKKTSRDGLSSYCKECQKEYCKEWRKTNREKTQEASRKYYKNNREKAQEASRKWKKNNREKIRKYDRGWRQNNPEKRKDHQGKYYRNNPERWLNSTHLRRTRKKNNGVFLVLKKELKKIYSSPCFACGSTENLTQDHAIPISRGGKHSVGNLITLCRSCNSSKGGKTLMEWRLAQTRNALVE